MVREEKDSTQSSLGTTSAPELSSASQAVQPSQMEKAQAFWDDFRKAVEDPDVSTYEFLKTRLLKALDIEGSNGFWDAVSRMQRNAIREAIELSHPRELRDKLKRLENNKLFFNYQSRASLKLLRSVLDTYIEAKDSNIARRNARKEELLTLQEEVEHIIKAELDNPEVIENIELLAQELTHRDKAQIHHTIEQASRQLHEKSVLKKMATDVIWIGKVMFHPDNLAKFAINSLPIITWQHRWLLAIGLGAFATRKAFYHGYFACKAIWDGDGDEARVQGMKSLNALKVAGGNVLTIGLTPALAKLPSMFVGAARFTAGFIYKKSIEMGEKLLGPKIDSDTGQRRTFLQRVKNAVSNFFHENQDALTTITTDALNVKVPHKVTKAFAQAAKRISIIKTAAQTAKISKSLTSRFMAATWWGKSDKQAPEESQAAKAFNETAHGDQIKIEAEFTSNLPKENQPESPLHLKL